MIRCQLCELRSKEQKLKDVRLNSLERSVKICVYCLGDLKALAQDGLLFP